MDEEIKGQPQFSPRFTPEMREKLERRGPGYANMFRTPRPFAPRPAPLVSEIDDFMPPEADKLAPVSTAGHPGPSQPPTPPAAMKRLTDDNKVSEEMGSSKQATLHVPSFRGALFFAIVTATLSFLLVDRYFVGLDPIANIMRADFLEVPYRWIIIGLVLFVAFCWYWEKRSKP